MRRTQYFYPAVAVLVFILFNSVSAQIQRGTYTERKVGIHRGNRVQSIFTNYGVIGQPGGQGPMVAWKYPQNGYVGDISILVGLQLPIDDYLKNGFKDGVPDTIHSVVICPVDRPGGFDYSPDQSKHWGFEPIPGFSNSAIDALDMGIAMSHQPETWPSYWPDHPDWLDENGKAVWNGYFGKGRKNANQESYFWMDDNADEKMFLYYGFKPDSTDQTRRGHGLQVKVRGMQWASPIAQDCIFWLYEIMNNGTTAYEKVAFGVVVGTLVGRALGEADDDVSYFNIKESITYSYDFDHYANPAVVPDWQLNPGDIGYIGYAFLESPGNKYDGIDNDGDNQKLQGTGAKFFSDDDFVPRRIKAGDKLVLIDKNTYERNVVTVPNYPATFISMGREFKIIPDTTILAEGNILEGLGQINPNSNDGIDNDLDGLIDENYMVHFHQIKKNTEGNILINQYNPLQYFDFITGEGINDKLIDERRDDLIDNDGDWIQEIDDNGEDGVPGTNDFGENDGVPTPGESNFDQTDVSESDQIGLTSFQYFVPSTDIDLSDEEDMWKRLTPGRFEVPNSIVNNVAIRGEDGDFVYGSGYFPLLANESQWFSLALLFGDDYEGVVRNKKIVQQVYDANYSFPQEPDMPTLTAVPGDGKVTLYWDKKAEETFDYYLQEKDFEGYKIYKSTDPYFSDCMTLSNAYGELVGYKPVAQYDIEDGIKGLFYYDRILYDLMNGVPFYLGNDTGLENTFIDNDVINGKTYFYAVCAYDKGDQDRSIPPSENSKYIYYGSDGLIHTDKNTAVAVPQAPVAGYITPESGTKMTRLQGQSTFTPYVEVVDPTELKSTTYLMTFTDSLNKGVNVAYAYSITDSITRQVIVDNSRRLWAHNGEIFDGIRLSINPVYQNLDSLRLITNESGWNTSDTSNLKFTTTIFEYPQQNIKGVRYPYDYMFVFYNDFQLRSSDLSKVFGTPSPIKQRNTNFDVFDITDKSNPVKIEYAFIDRPGLHPDSLSNFDAVILSDKDGSSIGWRVVFQGVNARTPIAGDTLMLKFQKPLSHLDVFSYKTNALSQDRVAAEKQMERIKAVPNPYVVSNLFEQPLLANLTGRGERVVYFTHLPLNAKVSIYSANGSHIRTLEHEGNAQDGTVKWDLRSKENLDVSYGVYFYVVEAPGIDTKKFGKLAVIK